MWVNLSLEHQKVTQESMVEKDFFAPRGDLAVHKEFDPRLQTPRTKE
jgi:hypothetical protein